MVKDIRDLPGPRAYISGKSLENMLQVPYIGTRSWKKTFGNFTDFRMIANVFLLPFFIF